MTEQQAPRLRRGVATSEFWLSLTVVLGGAFAAYYSDREWAKVAGILAAALASMGYGASRGAAKAGG